MLVTLGLLDACLNVQVCLVTLHLLNPCLGVQVCVIIVCLLDTCLDVQLLLATCLCVLLPLVCWTPV